MGEAEAGVTLPPAGPPAGPPGAGRGREGSRLEPSEEAWPCRTWTLDFWRPELREDQLRLFKPPTCYSCLRKLLPPSYIFRANACLLIENGNVQSSFQRRAW